MGGLNPCALPYVPPTHQIVEKESTYNIRNNNSNAESSKWHACKKKKGCRYKNNNNNKQKNNNKPKLAEDEIASNRFSRLQNKVEDVTKVTKLLHKVVENNNNKNEEKDAKSANKDVKSCDVDKIDVRTLDKTIRLYAKNDRYGTEEVTHNETSNVCSNNEEEKHADDDNENDLSKNAESSATSSCNHDDYDYDSYSDDDYSEYPSDFDEWARWNEKWWKHKKKVKSHSD